MKHFDYSRPKFAPYGFSCEVWQPQAMTRADQHDEIELNYLQSGSLTYLMGGKRVSVPAQRLVAFWASVPHQIVAYEGVESYYVATIPFSWFLKWGIPNNLHMRIMRWELVMDQAACEPSREQFMFEQWLKDVNDKSLGSAAALEIQARLIRMANHLKSATSTKDVSTPSALKGQDKAEQMACHVSRCYLDRLTIPDIAAAVDLHPDYGATLFKKTFGTTIVTFITRHRVAHAQRLLLTTDDQIISIASESGFDSLSRFNRAFKEFAGVTPREYRNAAR